MDTASESEVSIWRPPNVKLLWVRKLHGISIRRANRNSNHCLGGQLNACDRHFLRGDSIAELIRTFISKNFFNCRPNKLRLIQQTFLLIWMLIQNDESIADEIGCCFMTGIENKNAIVQ